MEEINLKKIKVKELRQLLKKCGIKGTSKMSKKEIIEMIEGNKETLEGAGFFDFLKGIGRVITQPVRTIKKLISPMEEYNYESEETLKKYGKLPIIEIEIIRTPISGMINTIFNALSLGKWEQLKKKFGYDKFFHLAMKTVVKLPDGKTKDIFIEKEEAPVIHTRYKENPQTERFKLTNYFRGTQTIKGMLDETLRKIGNHNFFRYEAFTINCQRFLMDILKSNELLTPEAEEFIYQPLDELVQELPQYVRGTAKAITDLGGIFSKLTGRGEEENEAPIYGFGMSGGSRLTNLQNDLSSMDRRLDAMEREAEEMLSLETELRNNINELRQRLSLIDDDRERQVYRTQINIYNQQLENILNRTPELSQEFQQLLERRNEIYDEIERIIDGERQEERAREARGDDDITEAREAISASAVEPAPLEDSDYDEFHFHPRGAIDSDSEGSFAPLRPRLNAMDGDSMEGDGKSRGYCCERCRLNDIMKKKIQGLQF